MQQRGGAEGGGSAGESCLGWMAQGHGGLQDRDMRCERYIAVTKDFM